RWVHAGNGAAAHALPQCRSEMLNMVRPGGVIYGLWRDSTDTSVEPLMWRPVLSLHTRVMMVRDVPKGTALGYHGTFVTARGSRIATLPIGYEDGLRRTLSNNGRVLIRGQSAPIVGLISMDLTLIDVTDVAGAAVGEEVVLIGNQGCDQITAE